jgi:hypothetical protein
VLCRSTSDGDPPTNQLTLPPPSFDTDPEARYGTRPRESIEEEGESRMIRHTEEGTQR